MKVTFCILGVFFYQLVSAQHLELGWQYGANFEVRKITNRDNVWRNYYTNCIAIKWQQKSLLIGINLGLHKRKIEFSDVIYSNSYYDSGQYMRDYYLHFLDYSSESYNFNSEITFDWMGNIIDPVSIILGSGIGYTASIHQKVLLDSLTYYHYHEYSNTPAGQYYETETYTYSNSSATNLSINHKSLFIAPHIGLHVNFLKGKFFSEFTTGVWIRTNPVLSLSQRTPNGIAFWYSSSDVFLNFKFGYRFKDLFKDKREAPVTID